MLDCGVPYTRLVNKSKENNHLEDVKIIFISHIHSDHMYFTTKEGVRNYSTAKRIGKEYPNIMWVSGSKEVIEVFEELDLRYTAMEMNKIQPFTINGQSLHLQLVKLYHDVENYGLRFIDDKKGIFITDTYTIDEITFKDYDYMIIEYNHDVEIHTRLANESEYPQRYTNAFNSHLNFEQTNKAINEFAKNGTEVLLVHLSSDEEYKKLKLELHYKYKKELREMNNKRKYSVKSVEEVQVIKISVVEGTGIESDPVREVVQYWTKDGLLLSVIDPVSTKTI